MKEIQLTQGQVALVDDGDYEELSTKPPENYTVSLPASTSPNF